MIEQAAKIQDPTKNRYGYAFRGGKNSAGQLMSILEAYNVDNLDVTNAYKVNSGATIFSTPGVADRARPLHRALQDGLTGVVGRLGLHRDGRRLHQRLDGVPAAGPRGDRRRQGVLADRGPVECRHQPVGPTGKAAWPMATAGWGVTEASKHTAESVKLVQFLSGDPSTTFAKENSLVPIQTPPARTSSSRPVRGPPTSR